MQESSGLFSFGSVEDTQIVRYQTEVLLPYNPFCFDMNLIITKSAEGFQGIGKRFFLKSGNKFTFGRKPQGCEIILKAPTVSAKHFCIAEDQRLYDMGSNKGTFKWIFKDHPKYLNDGDIILIGRTQFTITLVDIQNSEVRIRNEDTKQHILIKKSKYIIGSHSSCHHIVKGLLGYHILIEPTQARLVSMVEDEDISIDKGVWERLSAPRVQSKGKQISYGDYVMVFPYIFRVQF